MKLRRIKIDKTLNIIENLPNRSKFYHKFDLFVILNYYDLFVNRLFSLLGQFDFIFYVLVFLHTLYTTLFHILLNFLPYYAHSAWHVDEWDAALISALPAFMVNNSDFRKPSLSLLLDHFLYSHSWISS